MATTPRGIPLIDDNTVVNPISTPLNAMANAMDAAIDDALGDIGQGYYFGTNAQRLALTAPDLRNGITWLATDTGAVWRRISGAWQPDAPFRIAAGVASVDTSFPTIAFPAGKFTQPPIVTAQLVSGAGADIGVTVMVTNVTASSFRCRHSGSSGTRTVHWTAIQMTPTSAAG